MEVSDDGQTKYVPIFNFKDINFWLVSPLTQIIFSMLVSSLSLKSSIILFYLILICNLMLQCSFKIGYHNSHVSLNLLEFLINSTYIWLFYHMSMIIIKLFIVRALIEIFVKKICEPACALTPFSGLLL